jgi:hypothetical protein
MPQSRLLRPNANYTVIFCDLRAQLRIGSGRQKPDSILTLCSNLLRRAALATRVDTGCGFVHRAQRRITCALTGIASSNKNAIRGVYATVEHEIVGRDAPNRRRG